MAVGGGGKLPGEQARANGAFLPVNTAGGGGRNPANLSRTVRREETDPHSFPGRLAHERRGGQGAPGRGPDGVQLHVPAHPAAGGRAPAAQSVAEGGFVGYCHQPD